jgi:hypothetical protein
MTGKLPARGSMYTARASCALRTKCLAYERNLFNVDGTKNKSGKLKYYTDLEVQTGVNWTRMWFFLMDLGEHKAILGYSWFAAVQPKIDWK